MSGSLDTHNAWRKGETEKSQEKVRGLKRKSGEIDRECRVGSRATGALGGKLEAEQSGGQEGGRG